MEAGWCPRVRHTSDLRSDIEGFVQFYLQIPEVAVLFPCISSSLPSTVCSGAHFHAISAQTRREVREAAGQSSKMAAVVISAEGCGCART